MFKVVVEETRKTDLIEQPETIKRFEQSFDNLDIGKLAAFLNSKPRRRRKEKEKTT